MQYTFSRIRYLMTSKEHIVQSAQTLFAQFGLKKVTMDDIAREAHVSKATIYQHFKNKTNIFDDVIQDEADSFLSLMTEAVDAEASAVEKLRAHLITRLGKVGEFVNFYRVTQESWADYWPYIAQVRRGFLDREQKLMAGVLEQGSKSGELRVNDPDKSALVMILALASVEYQWLLDEENLTLTELVDLMVKMIVHGIGNKT